MRHFEVVVGNIGTVYSGEDVVEAQTVFYSYMHKSHSMEGSAAGEPVTMLAYLPLYAGEHMNAADADPVLSYPGRQ